jgi:2-polyprenyl-6-methoxyphenol hydroxylase-like FAD-dependent oxidoreductase
MPPIASTHHLHPLALPAQIIYYDNANPSLRIGVEDPGDNSIIRVHRPHLLSWLGTNIHIQFDKTASTIEQAFDSVTVRFTDGTSANGDILIGADGVHSVVRKHLLSTLNAPDPIQEIPIKVIVGMVSLSGEAFERQLSLGYSSWRVTKEADETGPAVRLFVGLDYVEPDGMAGNYFWIITDPAQKALEATSNQEVLEIVREQVSGLEPRFKEILDIATADSINRSWTLRSLALEKLPLGRVTLLGDAAHCMAPCKLYFRISCTQFLRKLIRWKFVEKVLFMQFAMRLIWRRL